MNPIVVTDEGIERLEAAAGAASMLEVLPSDQRAAVQARVVDERSYEEIASELRCSESVVRQRVSRGVKVMRARLKDG
jgi:RNA polymerase sigma-70 factor (ECF subfamily)